jgi:hypothetical protein
MIVFPNYHRAPSHRFYGVGANGGEGENSARIRNSINQTSLAGYVCARVNTPVSADVSIALRALPTLGRAAYFMERGNNALTAQ